MQSTLAPMSMTTVRLRALGKIPAMPGRSHAGHAPEHHGGHGQGRSGVARADRSLGRSFLDQIEGDPHRGIGFSPKHFHRGFGHLRHLGAVPDFDQSGRRVQAVQFGPDQGFITGQNDGNVMFAGRIDRATDNIARSTVSTHGVDSYLNRRQ